MEIIYRPLKISKLKNEIQHQGIGGKYIVIEKKVDITNLPGTIALYNFIQRWDKELPDNLYYGHVKSLGYFVAEEELVEELRDVTKEEYEMYW